MKEERKCAVCHARSKESLCKKCHTNPFRIEDYRNYLAYKKDYKELKKWYTRSLKEIPNLNTSKFWDSKLEINQSIMTQDGMTRNRIKKVSSLLNEKAKKILDIGAGHGYLEEYITKKRKLKLFANDFSKESVIHLKNRFKGDFQVQSIYKLNYPSSSFDAIFTLEVLEHIPPSKIFTVLNSIKKLLKKNGQFIVSVPTNEGLEKMKLNKNGHTRTYTVSLITAELEIAGFTIDKISTLYAFNSFYPLKSFISKFYKKWQPNNIIVSSYLK